MIYFIANWKTYIQKFSEATRLVRNIKEVQQNVSQNSIRIIICPPTLYLGALVNQFRRLNFGAQNFSWLEKVCTGETTADMLKNLGIKYAIIGHSERRKFLGESDLIIKKKIKIVQTKGLTPILCIGETWSQRKKGETFKVLKKQLNSALRGTSRKSEILIAYEPIWSIGTGKLASFKELNAVRKKLNIWLKRKKIKFSLIYGGSVNSQNLEGILKESGFSGCLVGRASTDPREAKKLISLILRI